MPIIYRDEQGVDLTADQVDGNFRFLAEQIDDLISSPPTAVSISNVTVSGSQMVVWLSDGSSFGPFTLPIAAFHWREDGFIAETGYFVGDFLPIETSIYLVLQDHVTGEEFDAGLESGGEPVYQHLFGPLDTTFTTVVNFSGTSTSVLVDAAGTYMRCLQGCEIRVPSIYSETVEGLVTHLFEINMEWHFYQASTDPIVFVEGEGISGDATINPYDGYQFQSGGRGRVVTLKYVGLNNWDIFGGLEPEA